MRGEREREKFWRAMSLWWSYRVGMQRLPDRQGDHLLCVSERHLPVAPRDARVHAEGQAVVIEVDQSYIVVGAPKSGKTTLVRTLVIDHLERYPSGVALVHDVNHQFRDICQMYETVDEYRVASRAAALSGALFPRGAAFGCFEAAPISELAFELGRVHNDALDVRVPIFLAYDETSMMESSGSTHVGRRDLQLSTMRRHLGISLAFNLQRQGALMQSFYSNATDVVVFAQSNEDDVRELEKKLGLPRATLQRCIAAERFAYAHWKQGRGLV